MHAPENPRGLTELYEVLKPHVAQIRRDRRLDCPPADSVTVRSALCGSELTLDARMENGRVREVGYRVRACSLGQSATAMLVQRAPGLDLHTTRAIRRQLEHILAGEARHSDWPELEIFRHIRDAPARHDAVLLPFRALEQLFDRATDPDRGFSGTDADPTTAQE